MSNLNEEDIAKYQKSNKKTWRIDKIESINFDENGNENGTWKGFSVVKNSDEANYCFDCRDQLNADKLCDFLNNECIEIDDSIDAFVLDNCIEWGNLITKLNNYEKKLYGLKKDYQKDSDELLKQAKKEKENDNDIIKELYGGNNDKTRKRYVEEKLADKKKQLKNIEFLIDSIKRRIVFLKYLVNTKTAIINVKNTRCDCDE